MIGLRETGFPQSGIKTLTGDAVTTVRRVWNQLIENDSKQRRSVSSSKLCTNGLQAIDP